MKKLIILLFLFNFKNIQKLYLFFFFLEGVLYTVLYIYCFFQSFNTMFFSRVPIHCFFQSSISIRRIALLVGFFFLIITK